MRTKRHAKLLLVTLFVLIAGSASAYADQAADEAAIRANAAKYVEAYNRRDSRTMASMWSPDAVYTDNSTGEGVIGREAIAKQLDHAFAGAEDAKLKVNIDSIEFVSPNVAIEKGSAEVSYSKSPTEKTEYSAVHVKRDGQWMLDRVSEVEIDDKPPQAPPSNYEHLKELEWMIGSWIDEDENATVQTDCEWTKNRNFMTRSFAAVVRDHVARAGMQIVGWDPVAKRIRSWVFDSDGGYSEGTWNHKGDKWIVQQKGTLPDGGQTTSTNIVTRVDDNAFTWQAIDRQVDGEMLPNIQEIRIVRKPAQSPAPAVAPEATPRAK
jgi:uncharacterized protein (TIGR02246 family)